MSTVSDYQELLRAMSEDAAEYANGGRPEKVPGSNVNIWFENYADRLWNEGYDDGYERGLENGYESGKEEGYDDGRRDGYEEGYQEGESDGYRNGYEEGASQL